MKVHRVRSPVTLLCYLPCCVALEWGKEGYEQQAASLASLPLEFVFAADAIYIDQVRKYA
jgi:hypothetical protein